jgi:hypothetical protein
LHGIAALQLRGQVEIVEIFIDPHAVFIHGALHVGVSARLRWRRGADDNERESKTERTNHFSSDHRGLRRRGL